MSECTAAGGAGAGGGGAGAGGGVVAESCSLGGEESEDEISPGLTYRTPPAPLALLSSSCPPGPDSGSVFLGPR